MTVFKHAFDLEDCNLGSEKSSLIPEAISLSSASFSELVHYCVTCGAHLGWLLEAAEFCISKKCSHVGRVSMCVNIYMENYLLYFFIQSIWGILLVVKEEKFKHIFKHKEIKHES